jgi:hypothetical protein
MKVNTLFVMVLLLCAILFSIVQGANIKVNEESSLRGSIQTKMVQGCNIGCFFKRATQCNKCSSSQKCVISSCHPCQHTCVDTNSNGDDDSDEIPD